MKYRNKLRTLYMFHVRALGNMNTHVVHQENPPIKYVL